MEHELLPDKLVRLWGDVGQGNLSAGEFQAEQELLLDEYRREWKSALLLDGETDLGRSTLLELASWSGEKNLDLIQRSCVEAVANLKREWRRRVDGIEAGSVETFYDRSRAMPFELMWWHTLTDDTSPLAYVVALKFAQMHDCRRYLDFGSGVGSGGILFAKNGISASLADISSTILEFSASRFARRGLFADHLDLKEKELPASSFDLITAMDVFEHLVEPVSTVRHLWGALKTGGFLFGRFHAELDEDRPHHIVLDFEPVFEELRKLGFVRVWRDSWLWGHEVYQKR